MVAADSRREALFELDHVALAVPDIAGAVEFYVRTFHATVLYADATWALLGLGRGKVALVRPEQHPPHVALRVDKPTLEATAAREGQTITPHRDGTRGMYLKDPAGNVVELICYPKEGGGGGVKDQ